VKTWLKPLEVRAVPHATDHGLVDTWRKKLLCPLLLFVMFESLLYIIVKGYRLPGQMLPFTVIVALSILVTQIRLITGVYVSNLLVGAFTSLYFIHQKFFMLQELTDPVWFKLLYQELKASVHSLLAKDLFSLGEVTITLCVMLGVWCLVYISLKSLVGRGRIIVLFLAGLVAQGLIFSYVIRTMNAANIIYLLSSLILLSLTRLDKLQQRWSRLNMFGSEDLNLKWGAGATLLIFCAVSLAALTPAPGAEMLVQDSRFQVIANLIGGTRSTQGSIEAGSGTWGTDAGNQQNNSFKIQPEILGGAWFANNTLVMSVTCSKPIYLRATSKEIYDGKGWDSKQKLVTMQLGYKGITTEKLEQKIQLAANFASPVGFGAAMPIQVTGLKAPYVIDATGSIGLSIPDTKPGTSYTVVSEIPVIDEVSTEALRNSGDSYPREVSETYLNLPPSIPARVRDLALRISGGKNNPYDKAQALVDYFQGNAEFTYDLKPLPVPPGHDFVDYFLFDSKKGYCTYYSTAMAIMARSIGIPSRWVIGYSSGEYNERTPDIYRVSEMNKHAWVELYFAGIGWVPFEPTKSFANPLALEKIPPQQSPQESNPNQVTPKENSYKYKSLSGVGLVILVIILVYFWRRKPGDGQTTLTNVIRRRRSSRRLVLAAYVSFLKLMQRTGRTRLMGQTPREFAQAREGDMKENIDYIERLTELFEQVRYGKVNPSTQQAEQAQADLEAMKQKLS
jgi:hypothetical protein